LGLLASEWDWIQHFYLSQNKVENEKQISDVVFAAKNQKGGQGLSLGLFELDWDWFSTFTCLQIKLKMGDKSVMSTLYQRTRKRERGGGSNYNKFLNHARATFTFFIQANLFFYFVGDIVHE
jgi:hypothetical protein